MRSLIFRGTPKLIIVERLIDPDLNRSTIVNRALRFVPDLEKVNWKAVRNDLLQFRFPPEDSAFPSTMKVILDDENEKKMGNISSEIMRQLGLQRARTSYVLMLVLFYYYRKNVSPAATEETEELTPSQLVARIVDIILNNDEEKLNAIREIIRL